MLYKTEKILFVCNSYGGEREKGALCIILRHGYKEDKIKGGSGLKDTHPGCVSLK